MYCPIIGRFCPQHAELSTTGGYEHSPGTMQPTGAGREGPPDHCLMSASTSDRRPAAAQRLMSDDESDVSYREKSRPTIRGRMTTPTPPRIQPAVARVKATLGGSIGGSPFQAATWFISDGTGTKSPSDLAIDASAAAAFNSGGMKSAFAGINHTSTQWQTLRLDYYPASSAAILVSGLKTGIAQSGVQTSVSAASQCMVITGLSSTAGRSGKSRTFLPATSGMGGGGQPFEFAASLTLAMLTAWQGWLNQINAAPAFIGCGKLRAAVQSLTLGQMAPITSVRVDSRPDRQEHREKRLVFGQTTLSITGP